MRGTADAPLPIDALSPRRRELLALLAKGLTNEELARTLNISPGTVRSHLATIFSQLGVANRTEAATLYVAREAQPSAVAAVLQRPAIAVLPLVAIGADPHTRAVAEGLSEDLAALFSRWCWFPVIATLSSAAARAPGLTAQQLGARLGARFLVDGTLQQLGRRWRLSAHIVDTASGHTVWNERRDFSGSGLFEVQDELCQATVAAAYPVMIARAAASPPHARPVARLSAWELAHEGIALCARRTPAANDAARERFRTALAQEPDLVLAHFGRGLAAYDAVLNQWGEGEEALAGLTDAAEACLRIAPHCAEGHYLWGRALQSRGEWAASVPPLLAAVGRNPSFALAHATLAQSLQAAGQEEEARVRMDHAARLGPGAFVTSMATLHFMRGEYEQALAVAERAARAAPAYTYALAMAASCSWWQGDLRRGRVHLAALRRLQPGFQVRLIRETFGRDVDCIERFARGLDELGATG